MFQCRICQVACSAKRISASPLSSPRQSRDDASLVEIAEMAAFWMVHWLQWVLQHTGNTRINKYIVVRANSTELFHYTELGRQIMPHKQNMHHNKYPKRYPKRQTQHNKQLIREADRQTNQQTDKHRNGKNLLLSISSSKGSESQESLLSSSLVRPSASKQ